MACFQIWQKDYNGRRVLWGFLNNLSDAVGIVQFMADGMREGWETGFEVVIGESHFEMADFMQMHDIKKRSFPEPCEDAGEKTCRTCHLWEDGEINIACPWGSNYEHYEDDYCSLWEKQN